MEHPYSSALPGVARPFCFPSSASSSFSAPASLPYPGVYRAPLFLTAAALQLMIWSAYEEGEKKWNRMAQRKPPLPESQEMGKGAMKQDGLSYFDPSGNANPSFLSSTNASSRASPVGGMPVTFPTMTTASHGGPRSSGTMNGGTTSSTFTITTPPSTVFPPSLAYYAKGVDLLRLAASRYRIFRDQAHLESQYGATGTWFPFSHPTQGSRTTAANSGPPTVPCALSSSGLLHLSGRNREKEGGREGFFSSPSTTPSSVPPPSTIAGGTNAELLARSALPTLSFNRQGGSGSRYAGSNTSSNGGNIYYGNPSNCGMGGSLSSSNEGSINNISRVPREVRVMAGLFDFYQWAQYDANLMEFGDRYCKY